MNVKFSQELAEDSSFQAREFIAGTDAVTLATDILALKSNRKLCHHSSEQTPSRSTGRIGESELGASLNVELLHDDR